jgi:hypothetical protein
VVWTTYWRTQWIRLSTVQYVLTFHNDYIHVFRFKY